MPPPKAKIASAISERIARELEKAILKGSLRPGDKLPTEQVLTKRHATSRPIVREAMRALKGRGLIVTHRGSGSYVAENAPEGPLRASLERYGALRGEARAYEELLDLRLIVETHCIRLLVREDAAPARARLAKRLERMEAVKSDLAAFGTADLAFHFEIVSSADNNLLTTIYQGLMPGLGERFARTTYTDIDLSTRTLRDHRAILAAVESLDGEHAVETLRSHLNWSREHLHDVLAPANR